jgi:hypothetical protein
MLFGFRLRNFRRRCDATANRFHHFIRLDEVFEFHLLELAGAEGVIARRDLIAKCLAGLRDAERDALPRSFQHVLELREDGLRGFGAEVGNRRFIPHWANVGLEHQVERPRRGLLTVAFRNHLAGLLRTGDFIGLIGAETAFACFAINHRVAERVHMSRRLPNLRVHDDGGFEAGNVVALAGHGVPPEFLHVALEFRAERAVVPKAVDAAVNLGGLKNEPAPLAQRHDFFHQDVFFQPGHRVEQCLRCLRRCK